MRKITLLLAGIIFGAITYAQPFIKLAVTNKGLETSIGALSRDGGIEATLSYKFSMSRVDRPSILSITVGKQILITDYDDDNYSVTPTIGYGYLYWKDFSNYDAATYPTVPTTNTAAGAPLPIANDEIMEMKEFKPVFGFEVAKDSYMGRIGLTANWCKEYYFGINLRVFPYRRQR